MKVAEYPVPRCKEAVWSTLGMAYVCELPTLHPGPCASNSIQDSVAKRDAWEEATPGWEKFIGSPDIIVDNKGNLT
jgi:hypothetical protein